MHQYQYVLSNIKSPVETISKQVKQKITVSKNRNLFWMSPAKEQSLQYDSNLVLAVMIYRLNEDDLPVFLLTALTQGNRCVFGEILEGYNLNSFRNKAAFLIHNQEMDYKHVSFGENTVISSFFTCEEVWLTLHQEQTGRCNEIVFQASQLQVS